VESGDLPLWMTKKGRTVLLQEDISKGNVSSNYRPITCLPLVWKILIGIIFDEIYSFFDSNNSFPQEQKGCRRKPKGTHDLLYIDQKILKEAKQRARNISMYKKAYDMIPHSWYCMP